MGASASATHVGSWHLVRLDIQQVRGVPQLQLGMLAAGTWSGLIVNRSATKGVRIFRMYRDDEYLYRMMRIVARVYLISLRGQQPSGSSFKKDPDYINFLRHTIRLARSATEVVTWHDTPVPPNSDPRAFV
eukprot:gene5574-4208_t